MVRAAGIKLSSDISGASDIREPESYTLHKTYLPFLRKTQMTTNWKYPYLFATVGYGVIRKAWQLRDATVSSRDIVTGDRVHVPLLLTDKLVITAVSGVAAPYLWPLYVLSDVRRAEIANRNSGNDLFYLQQEENFSAFDHLFR